MKKMIAELNYILTVDNSHEEDDEVFEYYQESRSDKFLGTASLVAAVLMLVMSLF